MTSEKKRSLLDPIAAMALSIFARSLPKPTTADLQKAEFKTSTQRLGLRFTEKIRNSFRFRWIKKK